MARLEGILKLRGTIDGINFYEDKETGQTFAKKAKGGHSSKSLKTDPNKIRIRENNIEFKSISKTQSLLMVLVRQQFRAKMPRSVNSKFATLMHAIKNEDTEHLRGERTVAAGLRSIAGKQALMDFLFSPDQGIYSLFGGLPTVSLEGGLCSFAGLTVDIGRFPATATHFKMQYFVVDYDSTYYNLKPVYAEIVVVSRDDLKGVLPDLELPDLGAVGDFRVAYLFVQFCAFHEGVMVDLSGVGMKGLRCLGVFTS
jgi:hypothetical protein